VKFNDVITFVIDKRFRYDVLEWSSMLQITDLILWLRRQNTQQFSNAAQQPSHRL